MAVAQARVTRSTESSRVDVLVHHLVSLVLAPDWVPDSAATRIAAQAKGDLRLLRLARLRLWRAGTHPRSRVTDRARTTLDLAIDGEVASCRS